MSCNLIQLPTRSCHLCQNITQCPCPVSGGVDLAGTISGTRLLPIVLIRWDFLNGKWPANICCPVAKCNPNVQMETNGYLFRRGSWTKSSSRRQWSLSQIGVVPYLSRCIYLKFRRHRTGGTRCEKHFQQEKNSSQCQTEFYSTLSKYNLENRLEIIMKLNGELALQNNWKRDFGMMMAADVMRST